MKSLDYHVCWALVFVRRRREAMKRARLVRARSGLAGGYKQEMITGWIRVARVESRNATLHFKRARECQAELFGTRTGGGLYAER